MVSGIKVKQLFPCTLSASRGNINVNVQYFGLGTIMLNPIMVLSETCLSTQWSRRYRTGPNVPTWLYDTNELLRFECDYIFRSSGLPVLPTPVATISWLLESCLVSR